MALLSSPCCNNSIISPSILFITPSNSLYPFVPNFSSIKYSNFKPQTLIFKKPHFPRCLDSSVEPHNNNYANSPTIIFLKGLAQSTSDGSLKVVFSQFGDVSRVKIIVDKKSKLPLGFAYIWFPDKQSALLAVKEMNGKFLDGRFIQVQMAKPGSCKPNDKTTPYKF